MTLEEVTFIIAILVTFLKSHIEIFHLCQRIFTVVEVFRFTSGAMSEAFPPLLTHMLLNGSCKLESFWVRQQPKSVITKRGQPPIRKIKERGPKYYRKSDRNMINMGFIVCVWVCVFLHLT